VNLGTIDSPAKLAALMDAAALPMAKVFTLFGGGSASRSGLAALTSPVSCPSGGSASYSAPQVTFTSCNLGGVVFSGMLYVELLLNPDSSYSAIIGGGNLAMSGGATGTLSILGGQIAGSIPITADNTYWRFDVAINGTPICTWSGHDSGPCPAF
jgi:hypothetical protein